MDFLKRVNPDTQASFALHPVKAVTGDYPTLSELCDCYGKEAASAWLVPQLADMTMFTGAQNLKEKQQEQLADILAVEGRELKVTELMLFFYRFKTGRYGRFYGTVDPMVVTTALQDFIRERNEIIRNNQDEVAAQWDEQARKRWATMADEIGKAVPDLHIGTDLYLFTTEPYQRRLLVSVASKEAADLLTAQWPQWQQIAARHFPADFGTLKVRRAYTPVKTDNPTT